MQMSYNLSVASSEASTESVVSESDISELRDDEMIEETEHDLKENAIDELVMDSSEPTAELHCQVLSSDDVPSSHVLLEEANLMDTIAVIKHETMATEAGLQHECTPSDAVDVIPTEALKQEAVVSDTSLEQKSDTESLYKTVHVDEDLSAGSVLLHDAVPAVALSQHDVGLAHDMLEEKVVSDDELRLEATPVDDVTQLKAAPDNAVLQEKAEPDADNTAVNGQDDAEVLSCERDTEPDFVAESDLIKTEMLSSLTEVSDIGDMDSIMSTGEHNEVILQETATDLTDVNVCRTTAGCDDTARDNEGVTDASAVDDSSAQSPAETTLQCLTDSNDLNVSNDSDHVNQCNSEDIADVVDHHSASQQLSEEFPASDRGDTNTFTSLLLR